MKARPRHVALILAAGGSRRLGRPKQLLTRDGETLVHRACRLAMATSPERLLLVTGAFEEQVLAAVADMALEVAHNPDWEQGLATSLTVAAKRLPDSDQPVLILGCDQPALEATHLLALLRAVGDLEHGRRCDHAATRYVDAVGMPALVPASELQRVSVSGDTGLRKILNRLDADAISIIDAAELALDIDTDDDLRSARERGVLDPV
ncbi:MAG: nucleotidyltransferase family protein [Rhodanobacteraceae bacterium]|nr:nucleotidyltransferase family protein [Xanthomonadales bacterium]MCP5478969.1 nucleotidyltransferase family protein [Rhodanobacteraceae bacterium]HPF72786.1 nucleotidyltransferase family protein [Xanthomonadaceae bacterium]HRX98936.1 nucleotidyltransferase family protein [Xanthomonadaceae bacterium]